MARQWRIHIARSEHKFSCAHMTVFPDGSKERLHGHNFTIAVDLHLVGEELADLVEFAPIKAAIAELCQEWKEHTLVPERNPHFSLVRDTAAEIEFRLCGKRYVLPREDVLLLPIDNVAVESLAAHVCDLLAERLGPRWTREGVHGIAVRVCESPGQGASVYRSLAPGDEVGS